LLKNARERLFATAAHPFRRRGSFHLCPSDLWGLRALLLVITAFFSPSSVLCAAIPDPLRVDRCFRERVRVQTCDRHESV